MTAAVVGVIATLAGRLASHVASPGGTGIDPFACALTVAAFAAMVSGKVRPIPCIVASGAIGAVWELFVAPRF